MSSRSSPSLSREIIKGTQWYIAMRWSIRGLGLISSAILARLLLPEDFGLMAIATVLAGLTAVFFEFGVDTALIQNNKAEAKHFDTAWSIRLCQSVAIAVILVLIAPYAADYYRDERITNILYITAFGTFFQGFENIGIVSFRKDMKFHKDFIFNLVRKSGGLVVTLPLAFYLQSYMALVLGNLALNIVSVVASYIMSPYRPRFTFIAFSSIWSFSQWVLVGSIGRYLAQEGDKLILGRLIPVNTLGIYRWGTELAYLPTNEILYPLSRALMPGFAQIQDDRKRLEEAFFHSLSAIAVIIVPLGLGFGAVAGQLVPLYLGGGEKWAHVIPIVQILVLTPVITGLYGIVGNLLIVIGKVKYAAIFAWIRAILFLGMLYPAYQYAGITGVVAANIAVSMAMFCINYITVIYETNLKWRRLAGCLWRPVLAGGTMTGILYQFDNLFLLSNISMLLLKILAGGVVYSVIIYILWLLSGKPDTFEKKIIQYIRLKLDNISHTE